MDEQRGGAGDREKQDKAQDGQGVQANLDAPPDINSDERDSERGNLYEDKPRPPSSLHEWQVQAGGCPP